MLNVKRVLNGKRVVAADHTFQKLCEQAVRACGPDLAAIERYVFERIDMMDQDERERTKRDLERVLSYRAPARSDRQGGPWLWVSW